ncbi:MAG: citrate/2-methylcitrate synthase [Clostridia bacterium]
MKNYSEITPEIKELSKMCIKNSGIDLSFYTKYDVKRGLRDINGNGVLAGLTNISEIVSSKTINGEKQACEGELYYRGYNIRDIINHASQRKSFGFETVTYLLLFGDLPSDEQLKTFKNQLSEYRILPTHFVRDEILNSPSRDMMNGLARSVLTLYSYDKNADDTSIENVLRQCMQLIATFPMLSVYSYHAHKHYHENESLFIHQPDPELSTAENILRLLRPNCEYTELEASVLDMALMLHAEHGGGNNSSFTTHVVSSSGTDTYSAISAALGSLKGPKHGGANIKVVGMFEDIIANVKDWSDDKAIEEYLVKILNKEAYDKAGLIYGMGHAVYSLSDPRALIMEEFVEDLATAKGRHKEFDLYHKVSKIAEKVIGEKRKIYKGVSANVDFFSGFIYNMLDLPKELYTPIFAIARISGWSAHRIEELINCNKIIRPAYKSVLEKREIVD